MNQLLWEDGNTFRDLQALNLAFIQGLIHFHF